MTVKLLRLISMDAFTGLIVLDLTRLLPGAVATRYFAERGATVIKIEQPGEGDYARSIDAEMFQSTNAGKKSAAIDLKTPGGNAVLRTLVSSADVLIEGFRPGVMARLGLGYPQLSSLNRKLIYASLTGYGQTGECASLAGHDINYIGFGGLLGLNLPVIPGVQIADLAGGSMCAIIAILTALVACSATGCGQYLDVSMTAGVTSLLEIPLALHRRTGREPQPSNEILSGRYACYNVYATADGRHLAVGALESKFWAELCRRLDVPQFIPLQFVEASQELIKQRLTGIFAARGAQQWFDLLKDSDCCVTPILTVGEVAAGLATPPRPPAPRLGENTTEVLSSFGYTESAIQTLKDQGAIA